MAEKKNRMVPQVRFKGFDGEWDRKPTSALLVERDIQAPKSEKYPLMAFVAYEGVAKKGDRYNREFLVNDEANKKYKQTELGDFIYSSNNLETGSIGLNNYGCASISPVYSIFKPTELGVSSFIGNLLVRKAFIDQMVRWRQGVVYGQWRIHESDFLKIEVNFPLVPEQQKIGTYFQNLDRLIGLHERKHEKLVTLKKAMLKKMFPAPGATTPEIRFKSFAGEWVEKSLGDESLEISAGGDVNKNKLSDRGRYPVFANALTNDGILGYYDNEFRIKAPAVTVTGRGDVGHARARTTNFTPVVRLLSISTKHDVHFLENAINIHKTVIESTGVPQLTVPQLAGYKIPFPPTIDEEARVGTYFRQLDALIAQHGEQLKKLRQLKAACLEKMFV